MDLWSEESLTRAERLVNSHHLNTKNLGLCSKAAATKPPQPEEYYHSVFFAAQDVPLPPSPPPTDSTVYVKGTTEKRYPDLRHIGFPSLDDKAAFFMSHPVAYDVPLPPSPLPGLTLDRLADIPLPRSPAPSPPPAKAEWKYPHLKHIGFPSLDDVMPWHVPLPPSPSPVGLLTLDQLAKIPLPPSPLPAGPEIDMRHTDKIPRYPDLSHIRFPCLDDEEAFVIPKTVKPRACDVSPPPSPINLTPQEPPLPQSFTPAQTVRHIGETNEKNYQDLSYIGFPCLDDEEPLPSRPPYVEVPHLAEWRYLDLSVVTFPCLDDDI